MISPSLFFGFTRVDQYYIATPEKAVLYTLYFRKSLPAVDEMDLDAIDRSRLQEMAEQYPSTVKKRLPRSN
jgi:hypothetical protein